MRAQHSSRPWVKNLSDYFEKAEGKVYSQTELTELLRTQGSVLHIPRSMTTTRMISVMTVQGRLREVVLRREAAQSDRGSKRRYVWGEASPYAIALSLRKGSYLSHSTAMFLHALTDQVPKTIYVNKEQSTKPRSGTGLSQPAIDRSFKSSPRISKNVFTSNGFRYVLLNGKQTGRLEISDTPSPTGELVDATSLERTLVDIVVRPSYAGGAFQILEAYAQARERAVVETVLTILRKLDHVYPYHQSIGFLMERGGYPEEDLKELEGLGIKWNFYLDYRLEDPEFDSRWRLFYPEGI